MTAPGASPTTEPLAITDAAFRKAATRKAATRKAATPTTANSGTGTDDLTSTIVDPKACDSKTAGSNSTTAAKAGSAATTAAGSALDDNRKNRPTHWHPAVPTTGAPAAAVATRAEPSPC
jgi:hypothetical protein